MKRTHQRDSAVKGLGGALLLLGALTLLGGCMHVSKRAWANGRALSYHEYGQTVVYGDHTFSGQRMLQQRMDPLRAQQRDVPYPYFGQWW